MTSAIDVGIKLGATSLQVAWVQDGDLQVGQFSGRASLPAGVKAAQDGRLVAAEGDVDEAGVAEEVVSAVPRLLGNSSPITLPGAKRSFVPEEAMAVLLGELLAARKAAPVLAAVVSCPTWCTDPQREAFRRAAAEAGLRHVVLLDQAVAAVEGARLGSGVGDGSVLVFHLGATSLDVVLVERQPAGARVIDRESTDTISLQRIDDEMADYLALFAVRRAHGIPDFVASNPRYQSAFARLRLEARRVRVSFTRGRSPGQGLMVRLPGLVSTPQGRRASVEYEVTRPEAQEIVGRAVDQAIARARGLLARQGQPGQVIFSGGGCLDPAVRRRVAEGLAISEVPGVDPLTVLVQGAARHAARTPLPPELASGRGPAVPVTSRPAAYLVSAEIPQLALGEAATIGRMDYHSLVLADPRVSRDHASIRWDEARGSYMVEDVSSGERGWGVVVNGMLLAKRDPRPLADGDEITIVDHLFRFVTD